MPRWAFVLTDQKYMPLGEIVNASNRQVAIPLNGIPTLSFQVPIDHPQALDLLGVSGYIKAYRDNILQFYGPVISAEEVFDGQQQTIGVNAAGVGWFLSKRFAGKTATGTVFTAFDRAQIIKALIDTANLEGTTDIIFNGDTGIATTNITNAASPYVPPGSSGRPITTGGGGRAGEVVGVSRPLSGSGTANISAASTVNYTAGPYKPIFDCLRELSPGVDGFDWQIVPFDNFAGGIVGSGKIGEYRAYPLIGAQRAEAIFEYGSGKNNIASYNRAISRDTQANRVYHNAQAGPDAPGYPTVSAINTASINNWRLMEDLATADLLDLGLRQSLVQEHVRIRAFPRQLVNFTPVLSDGGTRVPNFGVDFIVGDQVRARIYSGGSTRLDAWMRCYGTSFDIDGNGMERMTLSLAEE